MNDDKKDQSKDKYFMGMPMYWNSKMIFKTLWNKDDARLFPPKAFGVGWTINFHALGRKFGLIKNKTTKK